MQIDFVNNHRDPVPKPEFIIPGLLRETHGVIQSYGDPALSSWFSLQMAISIARGEDLFGICGGPVTASKVMLVVCNEPAVMTRWRLAKLAEMSSDMIRTIPSNMLSIEAMSTFFSYGLNNWSPDMKQAIMKFDPDVVIVDSVNRGLGDEPSTHNVGKMTRHATNDKKTFLFVTEKHCESARLTIKLEQADRSTNKDRSKKINSIFYSDYTEKITLKVEQTADGILRNGHLITT